MKSQIVFIQGGDSFASAEEFHAALRSWTYDPYKPERKRWRDWLATELAGTHEFFVPEMPSKQNADYIAWSIWFEKMIPYLHDGVILVGHSLGGGFLLRYLSEHALPVEIAQFHLVAPCVDQVEEFGINLRSWSGFAAEIGTTHLWHSSEDAIVPIEQSERFVSKYPSANLHTFTNRFHFLTETFPELLTEIQN